MRMAPLVGLEPTTPWLTVRCSTDWAKEEYYGTDPFFIPWLTVRFTSENIVALRASIHSASKLLIFVISRRKTILNCFSRSPTDWAKEEYKWWDTLTCNVSQDVGYDLFFRSVSRQVFSALQSLTSVFGMGTGGPFALKTLTYELYVHRKPNKDLLKAETKLK